MESRIRSGNWQSLRTQVDVKLRAITAVKRNSSLIFLGKYAEL
jgi:hypothetical protein